MKRNYFSFTSLVIIITCTAGIAQIPTTSKEAEERIEKDTVVAHRPGSGFVLVNNSKGKLVFSAHASIRYLNSQALEDSFTNYSGRTSAINKRNDLQFQKVMLYFKGWLFTPKLRYLTYVWTSNTSQGQSAQVVVGGNLQYELTDHIDVGAGIGGLPTNRSMGGQWPLWNRQDARPMADEYFRGSFTTGIWAQGKIVEGLYYKTMLGNNLSQLGIDAGQLDDGFDTWSTTLVWTTNKFSPLGSYSDFEKHEKLATVVGGSYSRSNETRQSQPGAEDPENSQIRISDGTGIFSFNAFAPNTQIQEAQYQMSSLFGGLKYKGFALDADFFMRWVSHFKTTGTIPVSKLFDQGFSLQASSMLIDKKLSLYGVGSYINGQYGDPWELNFGLNWFPFKTRAFRFNPEFIYTDRSPVGYLSYPTVVGAKGAVFMFNIELFY